ncbi:MAG: ATP-binding protein [Candidatus Margulisbacteria bacterium]|nr:ATP-binding protein [Candidatus Margulisiibacteriota bacterium]
MDPIKNCTCPPHRVQNYWNKLSGPLLDRIDLHVEVQRLTKEELAAQPDGEPSKAIRKRIAQARQVQQRRFRGTETHCNSRMTPKQMKVFCSLDTEAESLIKSAILHLQLSGRAYDRILKVARTIADLEGADNIQARHIAEATQYRNLDRKGG